MRRLLSAFGLIFVFAFGLSGPAAALSPQNVVGTWKLLSSVRQPVGTNKIINNLGANPKGVMIITPDHRFIIIEAAEGRKPANTTEEFAALQKSELAYSGMVTFMPDPDHPKGLKMINKVDISWNEVWGGTSQTRFLSLDGNRLTIRTPVIKNPISGEMAIATLVFERSK